jgi:hypothetical protein
MKSRCPSLLVVTLWFVVQAPAADVFERYLEVIGLREQHNGLLVAGFNSARMLGAAKGDSSPESEEAKLKRVKEIMIEEMGFDAMRSEYLLEVRKLFTEQELLAVIDELEKPAVAAILRRQAVSFSTLLVKIQLKTGSARADQAKMRISREVLGR